MNGRRAGLTVVSFVAVLILGVASSTAAGTISKSSTTGAGVLSWLLRNTNSGGSPDISFTYGGNKDVGGAVDWDGAGGGTDGTDTVGVVRPNFATGYWTWLIRNTNAAGNPDVQFEYGSIYTDVPVVGDWDGDGVDSVGVARVNTSNGAWHWLLRNANSSGAPDVTPFDYGSASLDIPFPLNWDGVGGDSVGVVRVDRSTKLWKWYLRNSNTAGDPDVTPFSYGYAPIDVPIGGDWDDDGTDTVGVARADKSTGYWSWLLTNTNGPSVPETPFSYGSIYTDIPQAGDYDGDGRDTIGVARKT